MIGPEAGEVMAAVQTAMLGGLPYALFREAVLTRRWLRGSGCCFLPSQQRRHRCQKPPQEVSDKSFQAVGNVVSVGAPVGGDSKCWGCFSATAILRFLASLALSIRSLSR
jgi:hypothetical protein